MIGKYSIVQMKQLGSAAGISRHKIEPMGNFPKDEMTDQDFILINGNPNLAVLKSDLNLIMGEDKSVIYPKLLGKRLLFHFFGSKPLDFWVDCVKNPELKKLMAQTRKDINKFVLDGTGVNILRYLEGIGNEKRRCRKEKAERILGIHVCHKCARRFKDSRHVYAHQKYCKNVNLKQEDRKCSRQHQAHLLGKRKILEERKILKCYQVGLEMRIIKNKSRAVFAKRVFRKGDFVCTYEGALITEAEAKLRRSKYDLDGAGSYIYSFRSDNQRMCIDATPESHHLGRLINHSRKNCNVKSQVIKIDGRPRIVFHAIRKIEVGEEILYDYGERDKNVLASFPFLKA